MALSMPFDTYRAALSLLRVSPFGELPSFEKDDWNMPTGIVSVTKSLLVLITDTSSLLPLLM